MMKKINFTAEEYAKRHHSGYLEKNLKCILVITIIINIMC